MTVARRMTRETEADCTPGMAVSAASTAPLQAEQCIPPTSTSMVCIANPCFRIADALLQHARATRYLRRMLMQTMAAHAKAASQHPVMCVTNSIRACRMLHIPSVTHRHLSALQRLVQGQVCLKARIFYGVQDVCTCRPVFSIHHLQYGSVLRHPAHTPFSNRSAITAHAHLCAAAQERCCGAHDARQLPAAMLTVVGCGTLCCGQQ